MPEIKWVGSPNFNTQNGISKLFITDHWMVGTLASTDTVFNGSRPASSTYGVGESEIHQYVQEKDYPYSDGNTYANQHTISIEHEGGWMQADGTRKTPSAAVIELSAQLHADIARRYGWGSLVIGVNVFPHSHWVATGCPGSLSIDSIVARANQLLGAGGGAVTPAAGGGASVPASTGGVSAPGYPLPRGSYFGPKAGPVASVSGYYSHREDLRRWQQRMAFRGWTIAADGLYGNQTAGVALAFQREKGLSADSLIGPQTWAAAWTAAIT